MLTTVIGRKNIAPGLPIQWANIASTTRGRKAFLEAAFTTVSQTCVEIHSFEEHITEYWTGNFDLIKIDKHRALFISSQVLVDFLWIVNVKIIHKNWARYKENYFIVNWANTHTLWYRFFGEVYFNLAKFQWTSECYELLPNMENHFTFMTKICSFLSLYFLRKGKEKNNN